MSYGTYTSNIAKIAAKIGSIGTFIDTYQTMHKGCVVIATEQDLITLYSPSFREVVRTSNFLVNSEQDEQTRKTNFEYAKDHAGEIGKLWKWVEEVKEDANVSTLS